MAFQQSHNFVINTFNALENSNASDSGAFMALINAACPGASHDSAERADPPKCQPNTREEVIKEIMEWVYSDDPDQRIMWFNGAAGAGKSAIAQTISERCSEEDILLSSFFFSRATTATGRNDGNRLIPTIAYHLATLVSEATSVILTEVQRDPAVFQRSMAVQLSKLVYQPIKKVLGNGKDYIPYLVIIDGLDECSDQNLQSRILTTIHGSLSEAPPILKYFVASRPERQIQSFFDRNNSLIATLNADYRAYRDIKVYLHDEFKRVKNTHLLKDELLNELNWPAVGDVIAITTMSSGHFIFAATVMKFVSNENQDPRESLKIIMESKSHPALSSEQNPLAHLDELYLHILSTASSITNEARGTIQSVLLVLHVLSLPRIRRRQHIYNDDYSNQSILTSLNDLAEFLGVKSSILKLTMAHLQSLIYIPADEVERRYDRITFHHASVGDFLSAKSRAREFFIDSREAHKFMANCCLDIVMNMTESKSTLNRDAIARTGVLNYESNSGVSLKDTYYKILTSSQKYSIKTYFAHIHYSDFNNELLDRLGELSDHTIQLILKVMLKVMHGHEWLKSLKNLFKIDFWSTNYAVPISDTEHDAFENIIDSMDYLVFQNHADTGTTYFEYIHELIRYINDPRVRMDYLWAAALMGSRIRGGPLYVAEEKVICLLRLTLQLEHCDHKPHFNLVKDTLIYYIRRFKSCFGFKAFIQSQLPGVDWYGGPTWYHEIESAFNEYLRMSLTVMINDYFKYTCLAEPVKGGISEENVVHDQHSKLEHKHATTISRDRCYNTTYHSSRSEYRGEPEVNLFASYEVEAEATDIQSSSDTHIKIYLEREFRRIKEMRGIKTPDWPTEYDIEELVRRSSGQLIYAYTAVKFISWGTRDPREELHAVIHSSLLPEEHLQLNLLYTHILSSVSQNIKGGYDIITACFNAILYSNGYTVPILCSTELLAEFLRMKVSDLGLVMEKLRSLIHIPSIDSSDQTAVEEENMDDLIKFRDVTFVDYLLDQSMSGDFFIDRTKGHIYLGQRCYDILIPIMKCKEGMQNKSMFYTSVLSNKMATRSTQIYSLENYFYHMRCSDFNTHLVNGFRQLPDGMVQSLITVMIAEMTGYEMFRALVNIFKFTFQLDNFATATNEDICDVCVAIKDAINHEVLKYSFTGPDLIEVLLRFDGDMSDNFPFVPGVAFEYVWAAGLMRSEDKIKSVLHDSLNDEHFSIPQTGKLLKYYIRRYKSPLHFEHFILTRLGPDVAMSSEGDKSIDKIFVNFLRVSLKKMVSLYLKIQNPISFDENISNPEQIFISDKLHTALQKKGYCIPNSSAVKITTGSINVCYVAVPMEASAATDTHYDDVAGETADDSESSIPVDTSQTNLVSAYSRSGENDEESNNRSWRNILCCL